MTDFIFSNSAKFCLRIIGLLMNPVTANMIEVKVLSENAVLVIRNRVPLPDAWHRYSVRMG